MDWNSIIIGLLGTTTLGGIFGSIVFYRENKQLKHNEVTNSDTETQQKQINLGELYQTKMLELIERVSQKQDSSAANQAKMIEKIDRLDNRMDKSERELSNIVIYLDGDYQKFLDKRYGKR